MLATDGLRHQVRELRRQAAKVISSNLRALLILGVDPGYRSGCKLVVIDAEGRVCASDELCKLVVIGGFFLRLKAISPSYGT